MKRLIALFALLLTLVACATASALPYYEQGEPSGLYFGTAPKGIVLVVHGGVWAGGQLFVTDPYIRGKAAQYNALGWRTLNVDYTTATSPTHEFDGYNDIATWYSVARYQMSNNRPVCAWGGSAGGHYVLLLDANTDLDCAIVEAAPTNLSTMPAGLQPAITGAFGPLANFISPTNYAAQMHGPVAMGTGQTDTSVPINTQGQPFVNAVNAGGGTAMLPLWLRGDAAGCQFAHVKVNCADLATWRSGELNALNAADAARP